MRLLAIIGMCLLTVNMYMYKSYKCYLSNPN